MQKLALIFVVYPEHAFQKANKWGLPFGKGNNACGGECFHFFKSASACFSLDT